MKQNKPIARRTPLRQGKPLDRGTSQLKRTELKRSGPIKPRRPADAYIADGPTPQPPRPNGPVKVRSESTHIPAPIRAAVLERDQHTCQRCGRSVVGARYGLQHRRPRGMGGSRLLHTMANLVVLCGWSTDSGSCTARVEVLKRAEATAEGWLVPNGATPEAWPVWRWTPPGNRWMQPGDEWTDAVPHPRQTEAA